MSGFEIALFVFCVGFLIAIVVLVALLLTARKNAAESAQSIQTLVRDVRVATDEKKQAAVALKSLRELANAKLAKASQSIQQWQSRYKRLEQWENVQGYFEKSAELKESVAILNRKAEALRNVIEGYGTKYIIPPQTILDQLASETEYTSPGQKLKAAREVTRNMVREETAAICDYSDEKNSQLAASFALDAFNGKAEAILSDVKTDNIGTLTQRIRDAFLLINEQGVAFRNARITPAYLEARLEELRCAALVQRIKQDERDEQRRVKARMQEETKVQREVAKVQKESQRKEDERERERQLIQKAQEEAILNERTRAEAKLREDLKRVSEEQRSEFEARSRVEIERQVTAKAAEFTTQIAEQEAMIKALQEQRQKAQSMAQQTKRGTVYIISNVGSFGEGVYKIGQTRRLEPMDRIWELGDASVPFDFDVHALIQTDDAPTLEGALHRQFVIGQVNKMNWRKEFFRVDLLEIKRVVEEMKLAANWTMVAKAQQFVETKMLEESFRSDPAKRELWLAEQLGVTLSTPNQPRHDDDVEDDDSN